MRLRRFFPILSAIRRYIAEARYHRARWNGKADRFAAEYAVIADEYAEDPDPRIRAAAKK